jgi:hypothetical protein
MLQIRDVGIVAARLVGEEPGGGIRIFQQLRPGPKQLLGAGQPPAEVHVGGLSKLRVNIHSEIAFPNSFNGGQGVQIFGNLG